MGQPVILQIEGIYYPILGIIGIPGKLLSERRNRSAYLYLVNVDVTV